VPSTVCIICQYMQWFIHITVLLYVSIQSFLYHSIGLWLLPTIMYIMFNSGVGVILVTCDIGDIDGKWQLTQLTQVTVNTIDAGDRWYRWQMTQVV